MFRFFPRVASAVRARVAIVLALVLAILAPVTAAAPAAGASTTTERLFASAVFSMINLERHAHGLAPLRMNYDLLISARRHDLTMARYNVMSHQLPHEPYFATRETLAGYHWMWAGENIAWNSEMTVHGVEVLESLMYNEHAPNDGHRRNILNSHFRDVGVDVYFDYTHHKVWLTTDFGSHY